MSCTQCGKSHEANKCPVVNFRMDGTILVPYLNGIAGDGVDLQRAIATGQTNASLKLDMDNNRLVLTNGETSDSIPLTSVASLIGLNDLTDVSYEYATDGDILSYDGTSGKWVSYTVPTGTPVSSVGVDADGKLVKGSLSGGGGGGSSVEVPIGGSIDWTGPVVNIPTNFKLMNGQEISRTVYSDYFNLIGTTFGAGNGTTTFNVPNAGSRSIVGYNPNDSDFDTIGKTGGEKTHKLTTSEMPSHSHSVHDPGHRHTVSDVVFSHSSTNTTYLGNNWHEITWGNKSTSKSSTGISIRSNGGSGAHNNMQPYLVLAPIVRVI